MQLFSKQCPVKTLYNIVLTFTHSCTQRRQLCKTTASSSGAVRVGVLVKEGHLNDLATFQLPANPQPQPIS